MKSTSAAQFFFGGGRRIRGWLGPALTETFETPRLLHELGLAYVLDWCADDQPFPNNVPSMISFDQLYKKGVQSGRVMALCLHPFIISLPFQQKYLERALA